MAPPGLPTTVGRVHHVQAYVGIHHATHDMHEPTTVGRALAPPGPPTTVGSVHSVQVPCTPCKRVLASVMPHISMLQPRALVYTTLPLQCTTVGNAPPGSP